MTGPVVYLSARHTKALRFMASVERATAMDVENHIKRPSRRIFEEGRSVLYRLWKMGLVEKIPPDHYAITPAGLVRAPLENDPSAPRPKQPHWTMSLAQIQARKQK